MLLLGFMCATAFLSMWMSNTATAAMMFPIAEAVMSQLETLADACDATAAETSTGGTEMSETCRHHSSSSSSEHAEGQHKPAEPNGAEPSAEQSGLSPVAASVATPAQRPAPAAVADRAGMTRLGKALMLGVAYAANIGGMATLTGTGPNVVLAGDVNAIYPASRGLSFATWLGFALPLAAAILLAAWALLRCRLLPASSAAPLYDPRATLRVLHEQVRGCDALGRSEGDLRRSEGDLREI